MDTIGDILRKIREKRGLSLREAARRSGLSHSYINAIEKGKHPKTKVPIRPSPETLDSLSKAYNVSYQELMIAAGYWEGNQKESINSLSDNVFDHIVREAEKELGVTLRDDPEVYGAVRDLVWRLARMKKR